MSLSPQWAFAFITDIHGNHTALQAVLDDVARMRTHSDPENFELVCLGDSFDGGPDPELVFDALEVLQCAHIRGNHEDYLFECQADPENEKFKRPLWKFVPWTVSRLQNSLAHLKKRAIERWSSEQCNLIAVHASASNNNRVPEFFLSSLRSVHHSLSVTILFRLAQYTSMGTAIIWGCTATPSRTKSGSIAGALVIRLSTSFRAHPMLRWQLGFG